MKSLCKEIMATNNSSPGKNKKAAVKNPRPKTPSSAKGKAAAPTKRAKTAAAPKKAKAAAAPKKAKTAAPAKRAKAAG